MDTDKGDLVPTRGLFLLGHLSQNGSRKRSKRGRRSGKNYTDTQTEELSDGENTVPQKLVYYVELTMVMSLWYTAKSRPKVQLDSVGMVSSRP